MFDNKLPWLDDAQISPRSSSEHLTFFLPSEFEHNQPSTAADTHKDALPVALLIDSSTLFTNQSEPFLPFFTAGERSSSSMSNASIISLSNSDSAIPSADNTKGKTAKSKAKRTSARSSAAALKEARKLRHRISDRLRRSRAREAFDELRAALASSGGAVEASAADAVQDESGEDLPGDQASALALAANRLRSQRDMIAELRGRSVSNSYDSVESQRLMAPTDGLLTSIGVASWRFDTLGRIIAVNSIFKAATGYDESELVGAIGTEGPLNARLYTLPTAWLEHCTAEQSIHIHQTFHKWPQVDSRSSLLICHAEPVTAEEAARHLDPHAPLRSLSAGPSNLVQHMRHIPCGGAIRLRATARHADGSLLEALVVLTVIRDADDQQPHSFLAMTAAMRSKPSQNSSHILQHVISA